LAERRLACLSVVERAAKRFFQKRYTYRFSSFLSHSKAIPNQERLPTYRLHKARSYAGVTIDGRDLYLRLYGSPESYEKYARLLSGLAVSGSETNGLVVSRAPSTSLSINELILIYFFHLQADFVWDGKPTSEQDNVRQALRFIHTLKGQSFALEVGPMALKTVRQAMIDAGRSRKLINKDVNGIRGMFGWAAENELLPANIYQALRCVKGLRRGRSAAKESSHRSRR
jgi:hypothetical protein